MNTSGKKVLVRDQDLLALCEFITNSLVGDQKTARALTASQDFEVTLLTRLPKAPGQRQADSERHIVKIPAGTVLQFFGPPGKKTSPEAFVVNDETGAWHINTFTGTVRRMSNQLVPRTQPTSQGVFNPRFSHNAPQR